MIVPPDAIIKNTCPVGATCQDMPTAMGLLCFFVLPVLAMFAGWVVIWLRSKR